MNQVSATDVTLLTLALADFSMAAQVLAKAEYYQFGGFVTLGIILIYLYHKFGSRSVPPAI